MSLGGRGGGGGGGGGGNMKGLWLLQENRYKNGEA